MFKSVLFIICFISFKLVVNAATAFIPPTKLPPKYAYEVGCYLKDYDKVVPYNQSMHPKNGKDCVKYFCDYDGYVIMESCISRKQDLRGGNCIYRNGDLTLNFPDCCGRFECNKDNVQENSDNKNMDINKAETVPVAIQEDVDISAKDNKDSEDSINNSDKNLPINAKGKKSDETETSKAFLENSEANLQTKSNENPKSEEVDSQSNNEATPPGLENAPEIPNTDADGTFPKETETR